jgi:hypothetical protein
LNDHSKQVSSYFIKQDNKLWCDLPGGGNFYRMPEVGEMASDFELPSDLGKSKEGRKAVVLYGMCSP